jgi:antitoxin component of MazEF toxin-antitoxin module
VIKVKIYNDKLGVISADTRRYDLRDLVDQITRENSHESIDWGKPVGKESW